MLRRVVVGCAAGMFVAALIDVPANFLYAFMPWARTTTILPSIDRIALAALSGTVWGLLIARSSQSALASAVRGALVSFLAVVCAAWFLTALGPFSAARLRWYVGRALTQATCEGVPGGVAVDLLLYRVLRMPRPVRRSGWSAVRIAGVASGALGAVLVLAGGLAWYRVLPMRACKEFAEAFCQHDRSKVLEMLYYSPAGVCGPGGKRLSYGLYSPAQAAHFYDRLSRYVPRGARPVFKQWHYGGPLAPDCMVYVVLEAGTLPTEAEIIRMGQPAMVVTAHRADGLEWKIRGDQAASSFLAMTYGDVGRDIYRALANESGPP